MNMRKTRYDDLVELAKELQAAERKSLAACEARGSLPPGSSRARVTTANARWATAAEARDRADARLRAEIARLGMGQPYIG